MPALRNTTRGEVSAGDVTFPAGGIAELPEGFEKRVKGCVVFAGWLKDGSLVPINDEEPAPAPEVDPDRVALIAGIIRGLPADAYTKGGKPEVDAINDALPDGTVPVTAEERDAIWAGMETT